jgi:hypothetical protein
MERNTDRYPDHENQDHQNEMYGEFNNEWIQESDHIMPGAYLLYEDPAIVNPEELATFPKQVNKDKDQHHHHQHESHLVNNKRTPVRDGRNITRTDNHPDRNGFM